MILDREDCPICGLALELRYGDKNDSLYTVACPTPVDVPLHIELKIKSEYQNDSLSSHYEIRYQNYKPYNQMIRVWPFYVDSYDDCSNIFQYDEQAYIRFVVETPYLNLPLNDMEKTIQKLRTYVNFS